MASRQVANTVISQSGFTYAGGQASASVPTTVQDILLSANPAVSNVGNPNSALATLVGTTILGNVVGPIEVWADGAVWDTTNSRFLRPGIDFDVSLLHRSGMGS